MNTNIKNIFATNAASRQLSEFEGKKMKELVEIYQGKIGMYYLVPAGFDFEDEENAYWTSEPSLKAAMTSEEFQDFMRNKVYLQKKKGVSFSLADAVMRKIVSHDFVETETDLYVFETIRNEIRKIFSNLQETVFECETIEPESFEKTLSEYYFKNFKKPVARAVDYYKRQCLKSPEEMKKRFVRFLSRSFFAEDADSKEKEAYIMELSKTDKKLQRCFKSISNPEFRNMWAYESTTYFSFENLELSEENPEVRKEFQILISEIQMELDGFREWKDKKKKAEKRKVLQYWADILLQKGYVLAEDTIDKIVDSKMPADRTEKFESLVKLVDDLVPSDRKKKIEEWVNEFNNATFRTKYHRIEDVHTILARDAERRKAEEKKQAEEEKLKKKQKESAGNPVIFELSDQLVKCFAEKVDFEDLLLNAFLIHGIEPAFTIRFNYNGKKRMYSVHVKENSSSPVTSMKVTRDKDGVCKAEEETMKSFDAGRPLSTFHDETKVIIAFIVFRAAQLGMGIRQAEPDDGIYYVDASEALLEAFSGKDRECKHGKKCSPSPHVRSEHERRQHFGEKNAQTKLVHIRATFVLPHKETKEIVNYSATSNRACQH